MQLVPFSPSIETDGQVAANDDHTTQVFSPYSGQITRIFVSAGQIVRQGQPLFAISASEFVQAQSDMVAAVNQLRLAQANEVRQHNLYKVSGAALKDWQQAQSDLANAQANLEAVRNRLKVLGKNDAQIAGIERAPASAGAAETLVPAPVSGSVMIRQAGQGQYVQGAPSGGSASLFSITDLRTVWLAGNVPEADAGSLRLGAPMRVQVVAFPGRIFVGRVNYISPVDPNTRRITVRAEVPNPDEILRPQMFATATIATGPVQQESAVPEGAVVYEGDTARVWVADPRTRTVALRRITAGRVQAGMVEALSGLSPGEQVVNGGSLFIDRAAQGE